MQWMLVTGGAGFIGTNFIRQRLSAGEYAGGIVNLDALTYAGNPQNLSDFCEDPRYRFMQGNILDQPLLARIFSEYQPVAVVHFAAESHVDRSIEGASPFIRTNVEGTFRLLEAARHYWASLSSATQEAFRFLHVSTDEVYGSLAGQDSPFTEASHYRPNSPYAASKAASDHLVRAWHQTYRLPTMITHCSNNYGAYQFPEKLIPRIITRALRGDPLTLYGDGLQIRDWLHVADHCAALEAVLARGKVGDVYTIGGCNEQTNCALVGKICTILDRLAPAPVRGLRHPTTQAPLTHYAALITHVADRLGHDVRYAINPEKIMQELGWQARADFSTALEETVAWYLAHEAWIAAIESGAYST